VNTCKFFALDGVKSQLTSRAIQASGQLSVSAAHTKMVYIMEIYIDGGCRGNGRPDSIGAAAAVFKNRNGTTTTWTIVLPDWPSPTNQRAEITAVILALEKALEKYDELTFSPRLSVKIFSDSRYAIGCMTDWIYKWCRNGWRNAAGNEVANRDLIEKASDLDDRVKELGSVEYNWIPRAENWQADEACDEAMDDA
jgi:ribonuclease HI